MTEMLKNSFLYKLFLNIRKVFYSNSKVLSQLLKRVHILDKLNCKIDSNIKEYLLYEVDMLLKEVSKRKILVDDSVRWCWEVYFKSLYNQDFIKHKNSNKDFDKLDIINFIKSRRSVRIWNDKDIEMDIVKKCIDVAQWAPSSCNRQSWYTLVLTNVEDFSYLKNISNQSFFEKAKYIIVCCVHSKSYSNEEYSYSFLDSGAFIQNLLLMLNYYNIGACWFGVKQNKKNAKHFKKMSKSWNYPENYIPVSFIALGKYDKEPTAPQRKDINNIMKII